jgi:CRISPR system Cascade subunit CasB
MDLMAEPETIGLFRHIGATSFADLPGIALLAGVLSHVREDRQARSVARLLGPERPDVSETAVMSPLRFRRLLEASEPDERLMAFRRMVGLAGGAVPVFDLVRSLLDWSEERRRRWIYDYWNAGVPVAEPAVEEPFR